MSEALPDPSRDEPSAPASPIRQPADENPMPKIRLFRLRRH